MAEQARGTGTKDDPWQLHTPPGSSAFTMHRDEESDPPALYLPPLLEALGLAEVTHDARNNRMRAR